MGKQNKNCSGDDTVQRYLDPTNDLAFKKLFGCQGHESLLISFLNAILKLQGDAEIRQVELLQKEQIPLIKDAKTTIVDVKCTDATGKQYIVEMQNRKVHAFIKRAQFYAAHCYIAQLSSGVDYIHLKPVILLCIANHELFPQKSQVISYHQTADLDTQERDLQDISYVFVELPKFTKEETELHTLQDKWLYFFKNWKDSTDVPSVIQEKELIEAYAVLERFNWTQEEYEAYLKLNIAVTDENLAREIERAEGRAEGASSKAQEIAQNMLNARFSIQQIQLCTNPSKEQIQSLCRK